MLDSIILALKSFVSVYGAAGLFLVMVLQAVVAPLPSDTFIILAVVLGMDPVLVVDSGAAGSTVGGLIFLTPPAFHQLTLRRNNSNG